MWEEYDVFLGQEVIGKARIKTEGLYYHFSCRCRLSGEVLCQVTVSCNDKEISLGICVPMGKYFGIEKKLPRKMLGQGQLQFAVRPRHKEVGGEFIPLCPEEPFAYLSRLEGAYLKRVGELTGIIPGSSPIHRDSSRPTGQ